MSTVRTSGSIAKAPAVGKRPQASTPSSQNAKYSACGRGIGNDRRDGDSRLSTARWHPSRQTRGPANQVDIMSSDLPFHSLCALSRLLARDETSSRAIVEACLARIAAHDGHLHAFIEVYRDDAIKAADAADRQRRDGVAHGPLAGLPIALKDLLHIEGRETTAGSKTWRGRISDHTATAVQRLEAAGMIPLGKTHMVEFAFGGWGRNPPMGAPWNPWDAQTHRVAGGSSSGSAVAVAGGLCPAAIGSDTGGSIRIPAALCGITGLKPTYGRVSLYGAVPLSRNARLDRSARAHRRRLRAPDRRDGCSRSARSRDAKLAARRSRSRAFRQPRRARRAHHGLGAGGFPRIHAARRGPRLSRAIDSLRDLGRARRRSRFPSRLRRHDGAKRPDHRRGGVRAAPRLYRGSEARHRSLGEASVCWVASPISAADYIDMLDQRRRVSAEFAHWMRDRDALLTPTLPITATPLADVDEATTPLATWTRSANYLGACALSLPAGLSAEGLPIGVQVTAAAVRGRDAGADRAGVPAHHRLAPAQTDQAGRNPSIDR